MHCIAAADCGTSSIKAGVFDERGKLRGIAAGPSGFAARADGSVPGDASAALDTLCDCLARAVAGSGVSPGEVAALALTHQRATLVCVDAAGAPLGPAISWQDMRGGPQIERLRAEIADDTYFYLTGLPNNPVFTLAKILRLREVEPERFAATARFSLLQDYLLRALGADGHFLDWSNASLTGLFDLERLRWSEHLLALTGLREAQLPTLVASGERVGALSPAMAARTGLRAGTPLVAGGRGPAVCGRGGGGRGAGRCGVDHRDRRRPALFRRAANPGSSTSRDDVRPRGAGGVEPGGPAEHRRRQPGLARAPHLPRRRRHAG